MLPKQSKPDDLTSKVSRVKNLSMVIPLATSNYLKLSMTFDPAEGWVETESSCPEEIKKKKRKRKKFPLIY